MSLRTKHMESFFQPILLALTGLIAYSQLAFTLVTTTITNRLAQVRCEKEGKTFQTSCDKSSYTCEEKTSLILPSPTPCP